MSKLAVASGCVVWLAAALYFETQWMERDYRPGEPVTVSEAWPTASTIPRTAKRAQVLLFVHPRCNCTKPAIEMLEGMLAELRGIPANRRANADVRIVSFEPETAGREWVPQTKLPVFADRGGAESRRFGVRTSGHVLIYGADGALLWQGGLTASRGSVQKGAGYQKVAAFLGSDSEWKGITGGSSTARALASVFGCSLRDGDWGELVESN